MVKISVIMPVYNSEEFIEIACESLNNQTFKDFELICVNDGSTDNSLKKINELNEKYGFIKVFNQENQGSGEARNNGLDKASGDYVAFLDADDIFIDEDALEKMYQFGIENDADMVGANLKRVSIDGDIEENFNYIENNYAYFSDFGIISPKDYGIPWAFYKNIFKRSFLNEHCIRFPDLKRGQDPVFLAEILVSIDKIAVVPTDLYGYNYAIGGGPNKKVNSYEKKYDYIKHFQDTFEVLEESNFDDLADRYKEKLFIFLGLKDNKSDRELFNIVHKIFGNNIDYYETISEELLYLRMNLIDTNNKDIAIKNYNNLRNELFNFTLNETYFLDTRLMGIFVELSSIFDNINHNSDFLDSIIDKNKEIDNNIVKLKQDIYETKIDIRDIKLKNLEEDNKSIKKENAKLDSQVGELESKNKDLSSEKDELKSKNDKLSNLNDKILNSNSWKSTKLLRSIRNIFRRDK